MHSDCKIFIHSGSIKNMYDRYQQVTQTDLWSTQYEVLIQLTHLFALYIIEKNDCI
jgi:hypothetical protein